MCRRRFMKASSEAIAIVISVAILITVVSYLVYALSLLTPGYDLPGRITSYVGEELVLVMLNETATGGMSLGLKNVGSAVVNITHVVVIDRDGLGRYIVSLENTTVCVVQPRTILPGRMSTISCLPRYMPIGAVSNNGRIYTLDARIYSIQLRTFVGIPMSKIYGGVMVESTSDLIGLIDPPHILRSGGVNTSLGFNYVYEKYNVTIRGNINASLVITGRNPVNSKLNIMIIGFSRGDTRSFVEIRDQNNRLDNITLSSVAPNRYRIKIENFIGTVNTSLGIIPCLVNNGTTCRIFINGTADRVVIYGSSINATREEGLDPYLFVGDIDSNDNTEILFITQDFTTGNRSSINDQILVGGALTRAVDTNINPLRFIFSGQPINGKKYSAAVLSVRLLFWDNSEDDISNNDNRIIVRAGLYDNTTGSFIYATYLGYYELNRYRSVRPFSISYIVRDFVINIPPVDKDFYVGLEIIDPFLLEDTVNDADIIIGIEYVGIVLSSRWEQ